MSKEISNERELGFEDVEKYTQELTVLKLKKHYEVITDKDFNKSCRDLTERYGSCDYVEYLSKISFRAIVDRIKEAKQKDTVAIYYLEEVMLPEYCTSSCDICEVVIVGNETIEAIKIMPVGLNYINAMSDYNTKVLAVGIIDKFLCMTPANNFISTVIQPNLMNVSVYQTTIIDILHEADYNNNCNY